MKQTEILIKKKAYFRIISYFIVIEVIFLIPILNYFLIRLMTKEAIGTGYEEFWKDYKEVKYDVIIKNGEKSR